MHTKTLFLSWNIFEKKPQLFKQDGQNCKIYKILWQRAIFFHQKNSIYFQKCTGYDQN